jgi:hypothetical protein
VNVRYGLTMPQHRVAKVRLPKSNKPIPSRFERIQHLYQALVIDEYRAPDNMRCTQCANNDCVCYYDRKTSVKCAECLRFQRDCDGTFSLEEFRKVGEQKKTEQEKRRQKSKEIARLRRALMDAQRALVAAEEEQNELDDSIAHLEEVSSTMLRREMQALGVFNSLPEGQEIALGDPNFVWSDVPVNDTIDWSEVFAVEGTSQSGLVEGESLVTIHSQIRPFLTI